MDRRFLSSSSFQFPTAAVKSSCTLRSYRSTNSYFNNGPASYFIVDYRLGKNLITQEEHHHYPYNSRIVSGCMITRWIYNNKYKIRCRFKWELSFNIYFGGFLFLHGRCSLSGYRNTGFNALALWWLMTTGVGWFWLVEWWTKAHNFGCGMQNCSSKSFLSFLRTCWILHPYFPLVNTSFRIPTELHTYRNAISWK